MLLIAGDNVVKEYSIDNSLRFNDNDSAYLSRTPASAGNRKTWTWAGWVKRGNLTNYMQLFSAGTGGSNRTILFFNNNDGLYLWADEGATRYGLNSDPIYRDVGAWYHIVAVVDTTQATSTDRVKIYVNGSQITLTTTGSGYPTQNYDTYANATNAHRIGDLSYTTGNPFDGYLADVHFIDGQALTPENFGETGDYGEWKPIQYTGTYGTNGFYLDFEASGDLGNDVSGNGNDWTPTNLAATDQMLDTPTNNFCTLTPLAAHATTFSEGNLSVYATTSAHAGNTFGTIGADSGKFYYECFIDTIPSSGGSYPIIGFGRNTVDGADEYPGTANVGGFGYARSGDVYKEGSSLGTVAASYTTGDIIGFAIDLDAQTCKLYKNNTLTYTVTSLTAGLHLPCVSGYHNSVNVANFGQDSSFAGNKTAQGNTDDNGIGDFYYTPPSGYLALCTSNLPDPTVVPSEHFNTVLYTGNSSTNAITGVGFQPDVVWGKARSSVISHVLNDKVRGAGQYLFSNTTQAEVSAPTAFVSFDVDGFTVGNDGGYNQSGVTYAAWNWKANGSGVSNTDGSITSTVSANTAAGFSIVAFTTSSGSGTVGHGLAQAPDFVIVKNRDSVTSWYVTHSSLDTSADYLQLEGTGAAFNSIDWGLNSSTFTYGGYWAAGENAIAYCFHSVDGFSKFGSYTGNGSTDGPFVYCGFRPAYVMVKRTNSTGNWQVLDTARDPENVCNQALRPNTSEAEFTSGANIYDYLSNGFKLRGLGSDVNASGSTYIFMAFAEMPFKHSVSR